MTRYLIALALAVLATTAHADVASELNGPRTFLDHADEAIAASNARSARVNVDLAVRGLDNASAAARAAPDYAKLKARAHQLDQKVAKLETAGATTQRAEEVMREGWTAAKEAIVARGAAERVHQSQAKESVVKFQLCVTKLDEAFKIDASTRAWSNNMFEIGTVTSEKLRAYCQENIATQQRVVGDEQAAADAETKQMLQRIFSKQYAPARDSLAAARKLYKAKGKFWHLDVHEMLGFAKGTYQDLAGACHEAKDSKAALAMKLGKQTAAEVCEEVTATLAEIAKLDGEVAGAVDQEAAQFEAAYKAAMKGDRRRIYELKGGPETIDGGIQIGSQAKIDAARRAAQWVYQDGSCVVKYNFSGTKLVKVSKSSPLCGD